MSNRRHFIRSIVFIGAALTARPLASLARVAGGGTDLAGGATAGAADPLSHAAFAGARGTAFTLRDGSRLILEKVSALERCAHTENFSVWLSRGSGGAIPQGTQTFEHATMGRFEMFVVAKTQADGSAGCEAVFNRLVA